ncbi:MAG: tellurite resistance TerB family protein [Rhodospirillaceae bacterium]
MVDHHSALVYTMVLMSASDGNMSDENLGTLEENVRFLPIFKGFDTNRLVEMTEECLALLADPNGLDKALALIKTKLSPRLRETAYAVACDIVASSRTSSPEELRLLEMLRDSLELDNLSAAAIERGAKARHMTLG